jgi:hypothetical protein
VRSEIAGSGELNDRRIPKKEKIEMQKNYEQEALKEQYKDIGLVIGVVAGAALSLFFAKESPGMIGVGAVLGVSFGMKIGEGLFQRKMRQ